MYYIGPIIVAYCVDNVLIFQGNLCWYCLVWPCSQAQEKGVYNNPFSLGLEMRLCLVGLMGDKTTV